MKLCSVPAGTMTMSPCFTFLLSPPTSARATPLTNDRIWSFSSCVSSPISPCGGMVITTSWVCLPVHSTRRKSALFSATVAISNCSMTRSCPRDRRGKRDRRRPRRQTAGMDDAAADDDLVPLSGAALERRRRFSETYTALQRPPSVPEVALYLADEVTRIWEMTEQEMQRVGLDPPFWAFAWAGGQALARYLLDRPDEVRGRRVLDLAAGSGLVAIAARLAGATSALAVDIDPFCAAAVAMNAEANDVEVAYTDRDLLTDDVEVLDVDPDLVGIEVILAGDVSYEFGMSGRMHRWLRAASRRGMRVLLGDPGRRYLPSDGLVRLASYDITTTPDLEEADLKHAGVFTYVEREDRATGDACSRGTDLLS